MSHMKPIYEACDEAMKGFSIAAIDALVLRGMLPTEEDPKNKVCELRRDLIRELCQAGLVSSYSASHVRKSMDEPNTHQMTINFNRIGLAFGEVLRSMDQ